MWVGEGRLIAAVLLCTCILTAAEGLDKGDKGGPVDSAPKKIDISYAALKEQVEGVKAALGKEQLAKSALFAAVFPHVDEVHEIVHAHGDDPGDSSQWTTCHHLCHQVIFNFHSLLHDQGSQWRTNYLKELPPGQDPKISRTKISIATAHALTALRHVLNAMVAACDGVGDKTTFVAEWAENAAVAKWKKFGRYPFEVDYLDFMSPQYQEMYKKWERAKEEWSEAGSPSKGAVWDRYIVLQRRLNRVKTPQGDNDWTRTPYENWGPGKAKVK